MKLTDFFTGTPNKIQETETNSEIITPSDKEKIMREIRSLVPGKILQGEVVEKNGSDIKLKVAGDILLACRLDQEINIEQGKILSFEVKNNGRSLSLSPLFANTANSDNVMKALQMAHIPVNNTTIQMTESMMKQGMSIDSRSLQNIFRDITLNNQASLDDIILLHQMSIPVTKDNIEQLTSYTNMTHQLIQGMEEIFDAVPEQITNLVDTQGEEQAFLFIKNLLQDVCPELQINTEDTINNFLTKLDSYIDSSISEENNIMEEGVVKRQESGSVINKDSLQMLKNDISQLLSSKADGENINELDTHIDGVSMKYQEDEFITKQELKNNMNGTNDLSKRIVRLTREPEFVELLKNIFQKNGLLQPSEVASKEKVKEIYQNLVRRLDNLSETIDNTNAKETGMAKGVQSLKANVDFMNQLNQAYTYIQLPLKMNKQTANGELYVFTNKKSLAKKGGSVSALLHLDMDHLGLLDVYIAMQEGKVNTRFTVENDDILTFLEGHMDKLTKRLEDKGYSIQCNMQLREKESEEKSPISYLVGQDKSEVQTAQYAFDVRA